MPIYLLSIESSCICKRQVGHTIICPSVPFCDKSNARPSSIYIPKDNIVTDYIAKCYSTF